MRVSIFLLSVFAFCVAASSQTIRDGAQSPEVLKDSRDGKSYKTVKIGNQVWMAENLNYEASPSWCYNNEKENCHKFGRYYFWSQAMQVCPAGWHLPSEQEFKALLKVADSKSRNKPGKSLKSKTGWRSDTYCSDPNCAWDPVYDSDCDCAGRLKTVSGNGTDALGFNVLQSAVGMQDADGISFNYGDVPDACFWTSTKGENSYSCLAVYASGEADFYSGCERDGTLGNPDVAYSVRCVKD